MERIKVLDLLSLEKRRFKGSMTSLFKYEEMQHKDDQLFSLSTDSRTNNQLNLYPRLTLGKKLSNYKLCLRSGTSYLDGDCGNPFIGVSKHL